jgi:prepilin-type N-terminal cleavage/methylation domain-containing protein
MQIDRFKGGFTLFELMLVIVIIGFIYALVAVKFSQQEEKELKLSNLPKILLDSRFHKSAEVVCLDDGSKSCNLYFDNQLSKMSLQLFKKKPIVYRLMPDETLKEIEFEPVIDEDQRAIPVYFRYRVRKNGSGDEMIVDDGKGALLMFAYADPVRFNDVESARDRLIEIKLKAYE